MESLYLHLHAQVVQVGHPAVVRVQLVRQVLVAAVGRLGRGVRAVGGRGADDAGLAAQEAVDLGHGVADAVEEDDVVGRDLHAAALVDLARPGTRASRARRRCRSSAQEASSSTISWRIWRIHGRDLLALLDRVADVLPGDLDPRSRICRPTDDLADRVGQGPRPGMHDVASHDPAFLPVPEPRW